jgi:hypothetical protein
MQPPPSSLARAMRLLLLPPLLLLYAAAGTDAQLQYDLDECADITARTHPPLVPANAAAAAETR